MKTWMSRLCPVAAALLLAACSQPQAPSDGPTSAGAPAAQPAAQPAATPAPAPVSEVGDGSTEAAKFTVEPGHVYACDGRDRVTSVVRWTVNDPTVTTVKIQVGEKGKAETQVFAAGGNTGETKTDNWVVDGTHFHLTDGASGRELATYTVDSRPCK